MSSGKVRRVSHQDIQLVQNLVERCLQLYMNQQEVVETLLVQAKIEPGFTELVWQKLEEENREFFKVYHLRLLVKQQILNFNELLEQQVELMHQLRATEGSSMSGSNGSHISKFEQSSTGFAPKRTGTALKPEYMLVPMGSCLPNAISNGGSEMQTIMHTVEDMSVRARRIDALPNMLPTQSSDIGIVQGMNGGMIKSEPGYLGNFPFMFDADGNPLGTRQVIRDGSFNGVESNLHTLNDPQPLLDANTSTYGFLGQIPRTFSMSDLTADFSHSSYILGSYCRSPFLATDNDTFLDFCERGENQGDNKSLGTISEYETFGSG